MLIKKYLSDRYSIVDFDPAQKAQGAPGIDIEVKTIDGRIIIGELKTTKPYQPGVGAAQRTSILKDLNRLSLTPAVLRFMFVTDSDAFHVLTRPRYQREFSSIEVVNLTLLAE